MQPSSKPLTMVLEHLNVHPDHMVVGTLNHEHLSHHSASPHLAQLNSIHQLPDNLSHLHLNSHLSLLHADPVHHSHSNNMETEHHMIHRPLHSVEEEEYGMEGGNHGRPLSPSQTVDLDLTGIKSGSTTSSKSKSSKKSKSSSNRPSKSSSNSSGNSSSSSKKSKKLSKLTSITKTVKKTIRRKEINQYSQSHQSRIRDTLHKKLIEVAGGQDNILPLLQNYFFSHEEGKKFFEKLHPPQQELQRYYNLLPILKRNCNKNNKKLFIRLLRQSCFTKSQSEAALGISICNDTWKKAGFLEEPVVEKKRKINDEIAKSVVEWMKLNTRPTKKTTQIKNENGEVETINTHCVDCCFHHLFTKFVAGLESKQIQIPGLETISESSFRKLIPKFIKLPKKKTECQV